MKCPPPRVWHGILDRLVAPCNTEPANFSMSLQVIQMDNATAFRILDDLAPSQHIVLILVRASFSQSMGETIKPGLAKALLNLCCIPACGTEPGKHKLSKISEGDGMGLHEARGESYILQGHRQPGT